jgi:hypothetical protein
VNALDALLELERRLAAEAQHYGPGARAGIEASIEIVQKLRRELEEESPQ